MSGPRGAWRNARPWIPGEPEPARPELVRSGYWLVMAGAVFVIALKLTGKL